MAGLIALLWLVGFGAAIFFIAKPKKNWPPFASRKRAAGMAALIFFGGPLLIGLVSPVDPNASGAVAGAEAASKAPEKTPEQIEAERVEAAGRDARRDPERFITLIDTRGTKAGFDTIMELAGTLKNSSPVDLKDAVIECDLFAESGTKIDSVRATVYKVVPANGQVRFTEESMGFAHSDWESYACGVVGGDVADIVSAAN